LHPPRHHRPPPRDRKNVLDRHQKRLVDRPLRRRNVAVHRLHQLPDALARLRIPRLLHRPQPRPPDDRCRVPRKLVLLQQLPHLQLHQVQNLRVVHHVHLVQTPPATARSLAAPAAHAPASAASARHWPPPPRSPRPSA